MLFLWETAAGFPTSAAERPLHLAAIALLGNLISHGDWTTSELASLENAVLPRLLSCVHGRDLDLQTSILAVLKNLITKQNTDRNHMTSPLIGSTRSHNRTRSNLPAQIELSQTQPDNAYLLQTILAGIGLTSNRPILADWLDFILSISAGLSSNVIRNVIPILYHISDALCVQIEERLYSAKASENGLGNGSGAESEIPLLLQAAELIVRGILPTSGSGDTPAPANGFPEPAGLFGYVSTVLIGDGSTARTTREAVSLH